MICVVSTTYYNFICNVILGTWTERHIIVDSHVRICNWSERLQLLKAICTRVLCYTANWTDTIEYTVLLMQCTQKTLTSRTFTHTYGMNFINWDTWHCSWLLSLTYWSRCTYISVIIAPSGSVFRFLAHHIDMHMWRNVFVNWMYVLKTKLNAGEDKNKKRCGTNFKNCLWHTRYEF